MVSEPRASLAAVAHRIPSEAGPSSAPAVHPSRARQPSVAPLAWAIAPGQPLARLQTAQVGLGFPEQQVPSVVAILVRRPFLQFQTLNE